jgi:DNA repair protein RecO (recombination protein O)
MAGGQGRDAQSLLQAGNVVQAKWRAKMADHLGNFTLEPIKPTASRWLDHPEILAIISSAVAVTEASLPERQPMPGVYAGLAAMLDLPDADLWPAIYVQWELGLLRALGYGLDLSQCAASGTTDNLIYVSPRTGRAVSAEAGQPYHDKLFPLPGFLLGRGLTDEREILDGLLMTGHFLSRHVFANPHSRLLIKQDGDLPPARQRLEEYYRKQAVAAEVA